MMTVITEVVLSEGAEPEWDAIMRKRLEIAKERPGWVAGQLLIPLDALHKRTVVGTWTTRAEWEAWHEDPRFQETRERLEGLQQSAGEASWHEVILDARREASTS